MKKSVLTTLTIVLLASCYSEQPHPAKAVTDANLGAYTQDEEVEIAAVHYLEPPQTAQRRTESAPPTPEEGVEVSLMIIKDGRITMDVKNLARSKSTVDSLLKIKKGYYQNEDYYAWDHESGYNLILRLPVSQFDSFVEDLASGSHGKIIEKDINARDVTEEYVDLGMRLANNEAYLKRYLKLLDRADSIKDMLVIQEKVRMLEEEIEARKGRMKYLMNRVSFGTLSLSIVERHPVIAAAENDHFGKKIASSFINGYNGVLGFIVTIISIWPLILIAVIAIYLIRKRLTKKAKMFSEVAV